MDMIIRERNEDEINALTHKIIGCAMQVHSIMGNGIQEVIYQRALAIEFSFQGLEFVREMETDLFTERNTLAPVGLISLWKKKLWLK